MGPFANSKTCIGGLSRAAFFLSWIFGSVVHESRPAIPEVTL